MPGPDGRPWQDTTIRGQAERGTGILNNELYAGQLVWNRCCYVKDPRTGRRLSRPNPPEQWERIQVPELRIVDDALWQAVKHRQGALAFAVARNEGGQALNRAHRRRFLLSGLLVCGMCGGGYTIMGKDRYGCAAHRSKGTCGNDRTIGRQAIEGRVLDGLKHRLLAPDLFEEFARSYQEECSRLARDAVAERAGAGGQAGAGRAQDLADDSGGRGRPLPAFDEGADGALEAEKARLVAELAAKAGRPRRRPAPQPAGCSTARRSRSWRRCWPTPSSGAEAMEAIRSMITRIVLTPGEAGGMEAVLEGDLARILTICAGAERRNARLGGGRSGDCSGKSSVGGCGGRI